MVGSRVTPLEGNKLVNSIRRVLVEPERGSKKNLRNNGSPSDQPPVLLNTTTEGDLLANIGAGGGGEHKLGGIVLVGGDLGTGRSGADVDHDDLVFGELGDLCLLTVGGSDTEETAEEVEVDLDFTVDLRETSLETQDVAD